MMNKLLLAVPALLLANSAVATSYDYKKDIDCDVCLYIKNADKIEIKKYDLTPDRDWGVLGKLYSDETVAITATYLGKEAAHSNSFTLGDQVLLDTTIGASVSYVFDAGLIGFTFKDLTENVSVSNGSVGGTPAFAFLKGYGSYDFLIGFNDKSGDKDYDDFVVGIKYECIPIPEPESFAMMLAGLGLMGFRSARRFNK